MEIWKDIPNYEGLYQVSNYGQVKSVRETDALGRHKTPTIMKPQKNRKGYLHVMLCKGDSRKHFLVHRLVAEAFIGERPADCEVNHIDEDKTNNRAENLEYVTHTENIRHGTGIDRRSKPVIATMPDGSEEHYKSATEASELLGVTNQAICNALYGKHRVKTVCGRMWRFAEV